MDLMEFCVFSTSKDLSDDMTPSSSDQLLPCPVCRMGVAWTDRVRGPREGSTGPAQEGCWLLRIETKVSQEEVRTEFIE